MRQGEGLIILCAVFHFHYNPQQDGVAGRKNQSIIETAKAMIHDMDLPMSLWAEACNTVVRILNRGPHNTLKDKTPEEAFTSEKPQVSHFRVFGCNVDIHVHDEKRTKFSPSSIRGILLPFIMNIINWIGEITAPLGATIYKLSLKKI